MSWLRFAGVLHESQTSTPRHEHDFWEIVHYIEGSGVLTVGGRRIPFVPGTIVAQPPGVPHNESSGGFRCQFVGLGVPVRRDAPLVCQDDEHGSFGVATELLIRECLQRPSGWETNAEHLLQLVWRYIERWSDSGDDLVRQAESLLLAQHADPELRIATVARRLGVAEEHLRRRFTDAMGRSPRAHLTRLRLTAADHLLARGTGVAEAAAASGFADPFYFSRAYRAAFGRAPSARRGSARVSAHAVTQPHARSR
jgi:AraC-like DNA-binding protein